MRVPTPGELAGEDRPSLSNGSWQTLPMSSSEKEQAELEAWKRERRGGFGFSRSRVGPRDFCSICLGTGLDLDDAGVRCPTCHGVGEWPEDDPPGDPPDWPKL